jgi:hypothetical protein
VRGTGPARQKSAIAVSPLESTVLQVLILKQLKLI